VHSKDLDSIVPLLHQGTMKPAGIFVPRFFPGALEFYVMRSTGPRVPQMNNPNEVLEAARNAAMTELRCVLGRLRLAPVGMDLFPLLLRLQWEGSLVDIVACGLFLGYFGKSAYPDMPLQICSVCNTPFLAEHGKKDCGGLNCRWNRQKRQQRHPSGER
jgi:hypothetical protein